MLSSLIAIAMDIVAGVEENVDIDGLKTMYHLFWGNPNLHKRKQFRGKLKTLHDEDAYRGPQRASKHLDEMASLIGVEIIVMSHGPRGDRQAESGWQLPKTKKNNKETQDKGKEKEREKEKTKSEGRKPGGGEKEEGRTQGGKKGKGKGGEGRAAVSAEPQWEEGTLDQGEWDNTPPAPGGGGPRRQGSRPLLAEGLP